MKNCCPRCGCTLVWFFEDSNEKLEKEGICANCRALLKKRFLFKMEILNLDAALKKPSILKWWFEEQKKLETRIDGDKSLRPLPPKWNPSKRV